MSKQQNNSKRAANLAAQQFQFAKSQGAEGGMQYLQSKASSPDPDTSAAAEIAIARFKTEVVDQGGRVNKSATIGGKK